MTVTTATIFFWIAGGFGAAALCLGALGWYLHSITRGAERAVFGDNK